MKFKDNILLWTLIPLGLLFVSASYFRFVLNEDYLVSYEASCDADVSSCFIGCTDETCAETYNYLLIERKASTLNEMCGKSVTDCPLANSCQKSEGTSCEITYCVTSADAKCSAESQGLDNLNTI